MNKKVFAARAAVTVFFLLFSSMLIFAKQTGSELKSENSSDVSASTVVSAGEYVTVTDEFDLLFDDAEDIETPVVSEEKTEKNTITISGHNFTVPLHFSGHLESELGAGYVNEDGNSGATSGVKFLNDLSFSTRIDQTFSLKGTLRTKFPEKKENKQWQIELYEMYFDYVPFSHFYITAGKKETVWGNIRLFSDTEMFEEDDDALCTNILTDSRKGTSMQLRIPAGIFNFTAFALYKGNGENPTQNDLSYAGSVEVIIGQTSFNFFGRKYPSATSAVVLAGEDTHMDPVIGAEVKRTILGFDLYAQELVCLHDKELLKEFGKRLAKNDQIHNSDLNGFSKMAFTGGTYRLWETSGPAFGFNVEFQDVYKPETTSHSSKVAMYAGISRLGRKRNITLGSTWKHYCQEKKGVAEPGIILSGIFPHAKWKNGVKIEYGEPFSNAKVTVGTSLLLNVNY